MAYTYFGSLAIAVCVGPVKELLTISNGETVIFEGPVDVTSADADGKTTVTTTLGVIDFYWGLPDQNINTELAALEIDFGTGAEAVEMPAYQNVCYAVCRDIAFGQQTTPPSLQFEIVTETSGLTLSAHVLDDDAIIPEAIYDYLTNSLYGAGIDPAHISTEDFEDAAEILIAEDLAASPDIDDNEPIRDTLSQALSHIDGVIYFSSGKLRLKLIRAEDTSAALVIDESAMLDEPRLINSQWSDTWGQTVVVYKDRDAKWEEVPEPYTDAANIAILGRTVTRDFNYPWFTRRGPALSTAKRLGISGGMPAAFWTLQLKPSWRTLTPASLVKLTYAKLGMSERVLRISEVRRNADFTVEVEAYEERTRDASNDYSPPDIIPPGIHNEGSAITDVTPRVLWLPPDLLNDDGDGVCLVVNKTVADLTAAGIYFAWDESSPGYSAIKTEDAFPQKGTILSWHRIRSTNWLIRVEMDTTDDLTRLQWRIANNGSDTMAVMGNRLVKTVGSTVDEHQMDSRWGRYPFGGRFEVISGRIVDIEITGAQWGSDDFALEQLAVNGEFPTEHIYFGIMHDFYTLSESWPTEWRFKRTGGNPVTSAGADTDQKRYFRVPVANHAEVQDVADVSAVSYDRDDTTMCPDGTLSRDWGAAAMTTYELLNTAWLSSDVEDISEAIAAMILGTATADQELLAEHISEVLGSRIQNGHLYYNV